MFNSENIVVLSNTDIINHDIGSYYKDLLHAERLYKMGITGKNLICAVLDTGCDIKHPLLRNKIIGGKNFTREGKEDNYSDMHGHGTHVAGLIASDCQDSFKGGIAPDSKLLICKVLESSGIGTVESIINAIYYAIENQVNVINMSLGSTMESPELYQAIKTAHEAGIIICCASGNMAKGDEGKIDEFCYPGAYQEVIEVGSINIDKIPSYFSNSNNLVDCVCYGEKILSTFKDGQFGMMDGTSQATPLVSGCVLLLKNWFLNEFGREPSKDEIYATLIKCSATIDGYSKKQTGFGYIDLSKL